MRIRDWIAARLPDRLEVRVEDFLNNVVRRITCTRFLSMPYRLITDLSVLRREYDAQFKRDCSIVEKELEFAGEYINVLLQCGDRHAASVILSHLSQSKRLDIVRRYFLPACLAKKDGYCLDVAERMSGIYDVLKRCHQKRPFDEIVSGKTVAVVGNGPSEVGKGLGAEIDSHDVVIRINNYAIDGYEKDYGKKIDIWVKASLDFMRHGIRDKNIKLVLYESNLERFPIYEGYMEAMEDESKSCCIDYCDQDDHAFFCQKHFRYPTTGLMIIHKLRMLPIKSLDVYGFSFLQDTVDKNGTLKHYSKADTAKMREINRRWHHMDCELKYFSKWFSKKNRRMIGV